MASPEMGSWPPGVTQAMYDHILNLAITYALGHGLTLLPPNSPKPPTSVVTAPITLFPTIFPRRLYQQAVDLQPLYNALYARVALDWEFLDRVIGESVAKVDVFQGNLWFCWKKIRDDIEQNLGMIVDEQGVHCGIFRSDYLLHYTDAKTPLEIKQVEFNTIASSFGALSQKASEMHRHIAEETDAYWGVHPALIKPDNYPINKSLEEISRGIAQAHKQYGQKDAVVLFVVQEGERNLFDQRHLQDELWAKHRIATRRHTFAELELVMQLRRETRGLLLTDLAKPTAPQVEVAVVYYRAGYSPTDYPTQMEWQSRMLLERSAAIKIPTMALQLAGAKKIQQVLSEPGVLEEFLLGGDRPDVGYGKGAGSLTVEDCQYLRDTWIGMWPLNDTQEGQEGYTRALRDPKRYVMKPQREGGGNNIYGEDIPKALRALERIPRDSANTVDPKEAYILMEMIQPPEKIETWLVKGGENKAREVPVVSELGVYGIHIFEEKLRGTDGKPPKKVEIVNRSAGTLLRTKGRDSNEGGVAIGISSIDSVLLV